MKKIDLLCHEFFSIFYLYIYTNGFHVISFGISIHMIFKIVGAISDNHQDFFNAWTFPLLIYRNGTGFILCAVIGSSGVHISSLFPWSAVMSNSISFFSQKEIILPVISSSFFIA